LNAITIIGGSGASGTNNAPNAYGGGAGRTNGLGGIIQDVMNGAGSSASTYGGGGGGGSVSGSTTTSGGTGGPGCLIIVPFELLNSKIIDSTTLILDSNFKMGGSSLTSLLDQGLVPSLNSNQFVTLNNSSLNTSFFKVMYPFGSSDTINYLNSRGFKTMPFSLSNNSIKYVIVRNTSTNLYYMTLFAENTCTLTTNRDISSVNYICCGNGGAGGEGTADYAGAGGSGGGVATGTLTTIVSGTTISITRASGVNTVLVTGGVTRASVNTGAGTPGSGITLNSGFSLASYGFGGSGQPGQPGIIFGTDGLGGSLGVNAASGGRSGIGYGAGAGGQQKAPMFGGTVTSGNSGVVILSFLI
jgi:hypothetical protein